MVKSYKHGAGKGLNDNKQVRRMESERLGPSPSRADFEKSRRLAPGTSRGPIPRISAAAAMMDIEVLKDGKFVVMFVVRYATYEWCVDSAINVVHCRVSSQNLSSSKRCWLSTARSVSLSSIVSTVPLASSKYQWMCVLLAHRSGNVSCCSPSMFGCT